MAAKIKLELTWIGKENRPRLEPRILIEEERLSRHAATRRATDLFDNILIRGDNLLGLKALEATHTGSVKCVFIDPPYNTGSAFTLYDDGIEHSLWLSLMRDRLTIIHRLLSEDGSFWASVDDHEAHYLKVLLDEVFGRGNFISNVVWQKKSSPQANASWISSSHDHILVYAKDKTKLSLGKLPRTEDQNAIYRNSDEWDGIDGSGNQYGRGPWFADNFTLSLASGQRGKQFAKTGESENIYPITTPTGRIVYPASGRAWSYTKASYAKLIEDNRIYFGKDGSSKPTIKRFLSELKDRGVVPLSNWHYSDVGENRIAMQESKALFGDAPFPTPKPERLLQRIIQLSTEPGDLVLDSFAGSGTTGAVAHKMGRRWIMVELGGHCETHIVPRLNKVIDGEDPGGITEAVGWKGGGGYRYFKLAPSLLEKDQFDNWVVSKAYNAEMLAEAMCKHFGFLYAPSAEHYWMHGNSSETDFIYVTTNSLTHEQLATISDEVGLERTLLICCKAFQGGNADAFANLTIRKIPGAILDRCEWGKDDYSLKIEALPLIEDEPEDEADEAPRRKSAGKPKQPGLFGDEEVLS